MKERPIIFSAPMVRAILDGRKTQTRRVMKPQPDGVDVLRVGEYAPTLVDRRGEQYPGPDTFGAFTEDGDWALKCPYGAPGERLWVKEAAKLEGCNAQRGTIPEGVVLRYTADGDTVRHCRPQWQFAPFVRDRVTSVRYMPRWASRITLDILHVRVERVQDISEVDAVAEGVVDRAAYAALWADIYGPESWAANPWVWVIEFRSAE